jgi:hypothetical protein
MKTRLKTRLTGKDVLPPVWVLIAGLALVCAGCIGSYTPDADGGGGGGGNKLLKVTHVNGFQGRLSNGSLIEIEVASTADGDHSFTLYISGKKRGTGTLTLSGGSITAIDCTDKSLTYSGGVCYGGVVIPIRKADDTVWVHWGVYYYTTMAEFNAYARQYNGDADAMYVHRPPLDDEGYYYGNPSYPRYDTPRNIYNQARRDHPEDAPPSSVLNQAIRVLNDHKNTGVGAYVSRGNLIAYYLKRVQ